MTDTETPDINPYEQLKQEMQAQYNQLKEAFEASTKEKDEAIAQLTSSNQELQKALLRSAFTSEGPAPEPEKTPDQLHAEKVQYLYERSKIYGEQL